MKKVLILAVAVMGVFGLASTSEAVFLGDTITIEHNYPSLGAAPQTPGNRTVSVGTSDIYQYFDIYTVNPEPSPDRILIQFLRSASWIDNVPQNGPVISNIDDVIQGVTVDTNLAGWDNSRLFFDNHSVRAQWESLSFDSQSYFIFNLDLGNGGGRNAVPEPASLGLLGSGLMGLIGFNKKRKK